jgi:hypothetical protein
VPRSVSQAIDDVKNIPATKRENSRILIIYLNIETNADTGIIV